jgi:hypothetical protein
MNKYKKSHQSKFYQNIFLNTKKMKETKYNYKVKVTRVKELATVTTSQFWHHK